MVSCFSVSQDCKHVHYIGLLLTITDGNFKKSSLERMLVIFSVSEFQRILLDSSLKDKQQQNS